MTVPYAYSVHTARFAGFFKLMLRWRGSAYKLLYADFAIFALAYAVLSIVYRFALTSSQREHFENVVLYCDNVTTMIPIDFVLGFYISVVVGKWQDQFDAIPWPDKLSMFVTTYIDGDSPSATTFRRTIMRYCELSFVICLRSISSQVKKRFPEERHLRYAGLITETEIKKMNEYAQWLEGRRSEERMESTKNTVVAKRTYSEFAIQEASVAFATPDSNIESDDQRSPFDGAGRATNLQGKLDETSELKQASASNEANTLKDISRFYFVPLTWAATMIERAKNSRGFMLNDYAVKMLVDAIIEFRGQLGLMFAYDWVCIPLAYTQVVTVAVYMYFTFCLMGRQFIDPSKSYENHEIDIYVPVYTVLQFIFYVGWLKVGESLLNPFGEDDDDFETNWMIDRNINVSYLIADTMHNDTGIDTNQANFEELPAYLRDSFRRSDAMRGSAVSLSVPWQLAAPAFGSLGTLFRRKQNQADTKSMPISIQASVSATRTEELPPVMEENENLANTRMPRSNSSAPHSSSGGKINTNASIENATIPSTDSISLK